MHKLWRFARKGAQLLIYRLRTQGLRTTLVWVYGRGFTKLTGIPLRRYSQITPDVYIGAQYGRRGKRALEQWAISGVVNLRTEFDDAAHGLALEHYCHLPTVDDDAPSLDHLRTGADFVRREIEGGGKVYIHCAGGVGRAPTLAAAYFITQGMTLDEALALIRRTRPFIHIMPAQMDQLRQFEVSQREKASV
jgi:protein-tyrosine phosphatase